MNEKLQRNAVIGLITLKSGHNYQPNFTTAKTISFITTKNLMQLCFYNYKKANFL